VGETTVVRRAPSARDGGGASDVQLGAVHLNGGGRILARLTSGASEGQAVTLRDDAGVAVAKPAAEGGGVFANCERTLPALLLRQAELFGEKEALVTESGTFSFAELPLIAAKYGALLQEHGVSHGDRVAMLSNNRLEVLQLFLGCAWTGAIFVPINTASKGPQLEHVMRDAAPKVLALELDLLDRIDTIEHVPDSLERLWVLEGDEEPPGAWRTLPMVQIPESRRSSALGVADPTDTIAILYTSGTTGPSKGVECPHAQFTYWGEIVGSRFLRITPDDVVYTCLPLFHTNALNAFVQALVCGAKFVLGSRFSASRYWDALAKSEATVTYLLGAMVSILASREPTPADRSHRVTRALAPATPAELWETMRDRFGIQVIEGHGMTETNGVIGPLDGEQQPGYMGRTVEGFHARVVDEGGRDVAPGTPGELLVKADEPAAFATRYWRNEEATRAAWVDGWFRTGDRVLVRDDGYYKFLDRAKDAIRRRGENISAWEVEQVLLMHPAIAAAAAIGVPSPLGEEDVMACLTTREEAQTPDPIELVEFCRARLPYFAVPRYIEFFGELPLTENGKVKKYALRERGPRATTWDRESAGIIVRP
jgi:crotonobetaine/carnitine-CoA ligase